MILWSVIKVIDKFSSCLIFSCDNFVTNLLLIISMTDSLSTSDQLIWTFSIQMIINIEVIFSSFVHVSVVILNALNITLLIVFSMNTVFFWVIVILLTRYLEINDWRFQANFFLNCWLSFNNCFIDKLIIKFIIFWMSNRFLFLRILIEFEIFNFLSIISFFTCSFIILTWVTCFFFEAAAFFDIIIDSSFEYFIIFSFFDSFSKFWNSFD